MSGLLFLCAFLLHESDGTILPNLMGRSASSPQFGQPVIVSCNSSENAHASLPRPQYQISQDPYFTPTILNYAPTRFGSGNSDEDNNMDIGNRIQAPISNFIKTWIPTRLTLPNRPATSAPLQNNFLEHLVEKTMDVEKSVKFYLFTRKNLANAQGLQLHQKKNSLNESNFSPELETKLIFHGFTDVDAAGEWVNQIKEAYLSASDVNLIVADFSSFPLHNLIRSSLPIFAARRLAEFINLLSEEAGVDLNSIHVIARSYGCHVVGLSGKQLGGKLGRITAMEPSAKIAIGSGNGGSSSLNFILSKENAGFVDVMHVNGQRFFFHGPQFGLVGPMGHVDIYPNTAERGLGCPGENMNSRRYSLRFCHLGRGVRTFTKSIRYPEMYVICQCPSFDIYKSGHCSCAQRETMRFLGEISNTTSGIFQLGPQQSPPSYFPTNTLYG